VVGGEAVGDGLAPDPYGVAEGAVSGGTAGAADALARGADRDVAVPTITRRFTTDVIALGSTTSTLCFTTDAPIGVPQGRDRIVGR